MMTSIHIATNDTIGVDLKCNITTSKVDVGQDIRYTTTYGIDVVNDAGQSCLKIDDISNHKGFVESFIELCIREKVALVHILDVLEDSLP